MTRRQPMTTGRAARRRPRATASADPESPSRASTLAALSAESDRHLAELIARRLALPLEQRMNFLRRRLPGGGSCL